MIELASQALSAEAFAPFGEVIDLENAKQLSINQGLTTRYHDLFNIDTAEQGGRTIVSVFRSSPLPLPHKVEVMERHPLGSQAFLPIDDDPFLVLVGGPGDALNDEDLILFHTNGKQGVNFFKNTWHHFQICLGRTRDFIVIDRGGSGENLEELKLTQEIFIPDTIDTVLRQ
jgi:ureidoglycolate lyase